MAVKVTLKNYEVESFDDEDHQYWERYNDGFLEVHKGDDVAKVFAKGYWVAVEGKQKQDDILTM